MAGYFAANSRLFEDIHRLQQQRILDSKIGNEMLDRIRARELIEHGIEIVERMSNLIN